MMSEVEPLDIEILSPTGKKSEKNAHKRCTTKTTLLVIIFLLVVLCFVFVLLYVLERVSNSSGGNAIPTTKPQPCSAYCFTQTCIASSDSK